MTQQPLVDQGLLIIEALQSLSDTPIMVQFLWTYGMKTNWCHYFILILLNLYMFRAYRPIFRRVRTAVHTNIGSVSVPPCSRALCVTTHSAREQSGTDTEPMVVWTAVRNLLKLGLWARNM